MSTTAVMRRNACMITKIVMRNSRKLLLLMKYFKLHVKIRRPFCNDFHKKIALFGSRVDLDGDITGFRMG